MVAKVPARRVLLVEDDPSVAASVAEVLRVRGCEVTTASSAEAGLRVALEHAFDVVVADYGLPGATGAWLLAQLHQRKPALRRVMFSGTPDVDIAGLREQEIFHQFVRKPCPAPELMAAMWPDDE